MFGAGLRHIGKWTPSAIREYEPIRREFVGQKIMKQRLRSSWLRASQASTRLISCWQLVGTRGKARATVYPRNGSRKSTLDAHDRIHRTRERATRSGVWPQPSRPNSPK